MQKALPLFLFAAAITTPISALSYDKVLMISIPKCGTHLMINALEFLLQMDLLDWPNDQFALNQEEINNMQSPLFAGHILRRNLVEYLDFRFHILAHDK